MTVPCEYCSNQTNYYSSNIDSFTGKKFDIYFCNHCHIGKTDLDNNFDLSSYYPENYYGQDGKKFNILIEFIISIIHYLRSLFCYKLFDKSDVKLLDIGCGQGQFINFLKKKGWEVYGTEFSSMSAKRAKKKISNDSIFVSNDIDELKNININFNIITLWHVLEHLKNPKRLNDILDEKLINKGFVVIEVPNFNSLQCLIDKNNWILLECPRHVSHFTKKSLLNLFDKRKFNLIKTSTFSLEFGFYGMLQSLMNLFLPVPNYLFSLIRSKNAKISKIPLIKKYLSFILTIILIIPLSFISIFLELLSVLFKKGGVIKIVIKKK